MVTPITYKESFRPVVFYLLLFILDYSGTKGDLIAKLKRSKPNKYLCLF